jgi:hypothetical protein
VERGLYISPEAFLEIAAFNQLALERGASPTEIIEKGHRKRRQDDEGDGSNGTPRPARASPGSATSLVVEHSAKSAKSITPRRAVEAVAKVEPPPEPPVREEDFAAAFKRLALVARTESSPAPLPMDPANLSAERIFGQVNRLLPIKIACRWLATAAATDGKWPRFDAISERLADDAATVGSLLEQWDAESERKRDELLATGLPRRGNTASKDRFLSQNIARVTRGGEVYPATICQYQLARFDDAVIALTEQGVAFAQIENPIVDKRDAKTTVTLTDQETEFLARHIQAWVPAERDDMKIVLQAVKDGKKTPTELTTALRAKFPTDWSDSVFQTHVSGLVARLGELRHMKRVWQGRNVNYELGDKVDDFLKVPSTEERQ